MSEFCTSTGRQVTLCTASARGSHRRGLGEAGIRFVGVVSALTVLPMTVSSMTVSALTVSSMTVSSMTVVTMAGWVTAVLAALLVGASPVSAAAPVNSRAAAQVFAQNRAPTFAAEVTLADYLARIEAAAFALAAVESDGPATDESRGEQIESILMPLNQVEGVRLETGEVLAPEPLLRTGESWGDVESAVLALRLQSLSHALAGAEQDRTEVRLALLEAVFERPEFTGSETLVERIWRWLQERLAAWFPQFEPRTATIPGQVAEWAGWVVVGVAALLLAILGSYWLQGIWRNLSGGKDAVHAELPDDIPANAATARAQAQEAAAEGNYRQAVRRLYLAALLLLDEQRLLTFDRSQTNREVLAGLPGDSPVIAHLRPVVDTFDAVWYGVREPDEPTYLHYRAEIDALDRVAQAAGADPNRAGGASR